jgi:hypothetical protein
MYEFIIDGYKRGYLRNYSMAPMPKSESHNQQESDLINQMQHILMRYTKSNIILGDDNPSGQCQILGKLLNKIYRKTGIKELDNLKIGIFDPAIFAENFGFDVLANINMVFVIDPRSYVSKLMFTLSFIVESSIRI